MIKQQLEQKLQQKLSPAQIQVIKMLELPTLEFEERINMELEENPVLEEGEELMDVEGPLENEFEGESEIDPISNEDFDINAYITDDETPEYRLQANNTSKDDRHEEIPFSVGMTFQEHLQDQLSLQHITEKQFQIALYVIGNIDEEGYLRRDVESIVDDLVFHVGIEVTDAEMEAIIGMIQTFEPAGVGARTLQECLLLQLQQKSQTPDVRLAKRVVQGFFDEFSRKHFDRICAKLNIDNEQLRQVIAEIVKLNPKPGSAWSGNLYDKNITAIVPDFILENDGGVLIVTLNNSNIPDLRINKSYNDMMLDFAANKKNQTREMKDAISFVKQKIDSARWFIDAIKQRNQTLLRTMNAIVQFQKEFFVEGDETYLRPMILKDIADRTGYDISTISRVSNSKYVQTEFGIFSLKYFFSESMTNDSGEEISTREIKKILQESIAAENKKRPLTDDQIVTVLKLQGYVIARRTVAKYREQLNIPVARLRKEL